MIRALLFATIMLWGIPALAVQTGKAGGSVTLDGKTTTLAFAVGTRAENLFDEEKKDLLVVLSDRARADIAPEDEVGLHLSAPPLPGQRPHPLRARPVRYAGTTSARSGGGVTDYFFIIGERSHDTQEPSCMMTFG
jgi:hypothetical protein